MKEGETNVRKKRKGKRTENEGRKGGRKNR